MWKFLTNSLSSEVFRQENAKYRQLLEIGDVVLGTVLRYERTERYLGEYMKKNYNVEDMPFLFLPEYLAQHLGLLRAPLIDVHHGLRIDRLALVYQLLMDAIDSCKGGVEVVIEFD